MKKGLILLLVLTLFLKLVFVQAESSFTGKAVNPFNVNITVSIADDISKPNITLIAPDNAASYSSNSVTITFSYNVSEENSIVNCSFILNGIVNITNGSVVQSASELGFVLTFTPSNHNWNINCTDNSNNIGNSSVRSFTVTAPASGSSSSSGSGGSGSGGGGGGIVRFTDKELIIDNKNLKVSGVVGREKIRELKIINDGESLKFISINSIDSGLILDVSSLELNFRLEPGESKILKIKLNAPDKPGTYYSKFKVNHKEVLITFDVSSSETIFDISIVVPDEVKTISLGSVLESQVTFIPMGENARFDVTSKYVIKDFNGKMFLSESDTFLIDGPKTFKKKFNTVNLPEGDYFISMELTYPNGVAVSSSYFKVKGKMNYLRYFKSSYILIILGVFLMILVFYLMIRYKKGRMHEFRRRK